MTARELAKAVIEVLDAQKKYFKSRTQNDLVASKQLEAALRKSATAILEQSEEEIKVYGV